MLLEPRDVPRAPVEVRAAALGLQPVVWPDPFPFDSELAMLVATYAKRIGRTVAFAQAAFRQAFAGGHALSEESWVLIAAAACEMHPRAVLTAVKGRGVREELVRASDHAQARGVTEVPAVWANGQLVLGEERLAKAGALLV